MTYKKEGTVIKFNFKLTDKFHIEFYLIPTV